MYVNVAHSIGSESETLFKITGTCGQDPMVPLISHPSFFLTSICVHVHNILQLSMYLCMTYIQKTAIQHIPSVLLAKEEIFDNCRIALCSFEISTKNDKQNFTVLFFKQTRLRSLPNATLHLF